MAYFSNSSDGSHLEDQCARCPLGEEPCPILLGQMLYNYEQFTDGKPNQVADVLNTYINKKGDCQMLPLLLEKLPPP